jgi:hypothetical protein
MLHKRAKYTTILFPIYRLKFSVPFYQLQMHGCYIFSSNQRLDIYHHIFFTAWHIHRAGAPSSADPIAIN